MVQQKKSTKHPSAKKREESRKKRLQIWGQLKFERNKTAKDIANELGVGVGYVSKINKKYNVRSADEFSDSKRISGRIKESIANDLRSSSLSQAAIARKYGVGHTTVEKIKKEKGITTKKKRLQKLNLISEKEKLDLLKKNNEKLKALTWCFYLNSRGYGSNLKDFRQIAEIAFLNALDYADPALYPESYAYKGVKFALLKEFRKLKNKSKNMKRLENVANFKGSGKERNWQETIANPPMLLREIREEQRIALKKYLLELFSSKRLTPTEQKIMKHYLDIGDEKGWQTKLAEELGVSREAVSQPYRNAVKKLKLNERLREWADKNLDLDF